MDQELADKLQWLEENCPFVLHTNVGRLFSTVRRMKAERELNIPMEYRLRAAHSVKFGKAANELAEQQWEEFYQTLSNSLKRQYPEMHERLFGKLPEQAGH